MAETEQRSLLPEVARPAPAERAVPAKTEWAPRNDQEFVDYFMYMLTAPIVGHPGWVDTLKDQWDKVLMDRMVHHKEIFAQQMCTEFEAMLYISTVSLAMPINHDWSMVYMWLFRRWSPEAARAIGSTDVPGELDPNQADDLAALRRWIFKTQRLRLKQKGKVSQEILDQEKKEVEEEQLRFF